MAFLLPFFRHSYTSGLRLFFCPLSVPTSACFLLPIRCRCLVNNISSLVYNWNQQRIKHSFNRIQSVNCIQIVFYRDDSIINQGSRFKHGKGRFVYVSVDNICLSYVNRFSRCAIPGISEPLQSLIHQGIPSWEFLLYS